MGPGFNQAKYVIVTNQTLQTEQFVAYLLVDELDDIEGMRPENYVSLKELFQDNNYIPTFNGAIEPGLSVNWPGLRFINVSFDVIRTKDFVNQHKWDNGREPSQLSYGYGYLTIDYENDTEEISINPTPQPSKEGNIAVMLSGDCVLPDNIQIQCSFTTASGHSIFHPICLTNLKRVGGFKHNWEYRVTPNYLNPSTDNNGDTFLTTSECDVHAGQTLAYFQTSNGDANSLEGVIYRSSTIRVKDSNTPQTNTRPNGG